MKIKIAIKYDTDVDDKILYVGDCKNIDVMNGIDKDGELVTCFTINDYDVISKVRNAIKDTGNRMKDYRDNFSKDYLRQQEKYLKGVLHLMVKEERIRVEKEKFINNVLWNLRL